MYWFVDENLPIDENNKKNALSKARKDINVILSREGLKKINVNFYNLNRDNNGILEKIAMHQKVKRIWDKSLNMLSKDDVVLMQLPAINHSIFLHRVIKRLKRKGVFFVAIIHDLETLRLYNSPNSGLLNKIRMKKEESNELLLFDKIVVHNTKMKDQLVSLFEIDKSKVIVLGIFDYLIEGDFEPGYNNKEIDKDSCIVAGNLSREKSAFIYDLPSKPCFELYGVGYDEDDRQNVKYNGSYLPDDLPYHLVGGFGLVWDGDSVGTCSGAWGEYLKYNNPHKTSLYLACGIPVIIWSQAALADYVLEKDVGLTVDSLYDLDEVIGKITKNRYQEMRNNAIRLSEELRNGENTIDALKKCGLRI